MTTNNQAKQDIETKLGYLKEAYANEIIECELAINSKFTQLHACTEDSREALIYRKALMVESLQHALSSSYARQQSIKRELEGLQFALSAINHYQEK